MKKIKLFMVLILFVMLIPIFTAAEELTNEEIKKSETKIFRTITLLDIEGNPIDSASFEITEEQFLNNTPAQDEYLFLRTQARSSGSHTTDAKKLTLEIAPVGASMNIKDVNITLEWLTMPNVRLYDVIGYYQTAGSLQSDLEQEVFTVKQIYDVSGVDKEITYTSSSGNRISQQTSRHGEALVMNIVNDASTKLKITLNHRIMGDYSGLKINASYQHATNTSITASDAKTLEFGNSTSSSTKMVLGSTFIYSKTIGNKYDRMAGVSVTYDPTDL